MTVLQINQISMKYEKRKILDDFSLEVQHGNLLVILGESGCGKTTLLKIVAGLIIPESGTIMVDGIDTTHLQPQKRNVGYVPQAQVLFPHMRIRENIVFGLKSRKLSKDKMQQKLYFL